MLAYKFTGPGAVGVFTGLRWPAPAHGAPGAWVRAPDQLAACVAGVHACRVAHLPYWLAPELWEIELAGAVIHSTYKLVAPAGRLVRRIEGWPSVERAFAVDCADRALALAVSSLRDAGLAAEATAAAAAAGAAAELAAIAEAVAPRAPGLEATLVAYAADCVRDIERGYHAMCAYVAATAFANASTATLAGDMSSVGWVEERGRQATWLADRLGLVA